MPVGFGIGLKKGVAGKHPALMIGGKVYVHHHHLAAQQLAGTRPGPSDLYGWVELDANGNVIWCNGFQSDPQRGRIRDYSFFFG